jgi:hypothetical protein
MGFLDFLKGIGNFVKSGIQKVAGFVGKVAPVVSKITGMIPLPFTQGIAGMANLVGQVANTVNGTDPNASAQAPAQAQVPAQVPAGTQQPQMLGQTQVPLGTAPPAGPIM